METARKALGNMASQKSDITHQVKEYATSILDAIDSHTPVEVYDEQSAQLLCRLLGIDAGYLVCCEKSFDKGRLERFIGKDVQEQNGIVYWVEGAVRHEAQQETSCEHPQNAEIKAGEQASRRTSLSSLRDEATKFSDDIDSVALPQWLDRFIFEQLHAHYAPSGVARRFDMNLEADDERIKTYLGTYFPRSFAESYAIFSNYFLIPYIFEKPDAAKRLRVLSIGTGTGGDLFGLLDALDRVASEDVSVDVISIEGNSKSHAVAKKLAKEASHRYNYRLSLQCADYVFRDFEFSACELLGQGKSFDFIICSKMINELIRSDETLIDSYYNFCRSFLPLLACGGCCLLLDVTCPCIDTREDETYCPKLLNEQVNRFINESSGFSTLLPSACSRNEDACSVRGCFTQAEMCVRHSRAASGDISKFCYRLICRNQDQRAEAAASIRCRDTEETSFPYPNVDELKHTCSMLA